VSEQLSDSELIRAYLAGNNDAFDVLYGRYERPVFSFLLSLGGSWAQAEDVMQQTWIKAIHGLPAYRDQGKFQAWVFQIAHRQWLDLVRSAWERRRVSLESAEDSVGPPLDERLVDTRLLPSEAAAHGEERAQLYEALDQMPDRMRQAVLLRVDGDMTYKEIAAAMECPLATALWRVREAEKRLKTLLGATA
jgi:RNA polymerase sigma-70 factor, ECF subfamily